MSKITVFNLIYQFVFNFYTVVYTVDFLGVKLGFVFLLGTSVFYKTNNGRTIKMPNGSTRKLHLKKQFLRATAYLPFSCSPVDTRRACVLYLYCRFKHQFCWAELFVLESDPLPRKQVFTSRPSSDGYRPWKKKPRTRAFKHRRDLSDVVQ